MGHSPILPIITKEEGAYVLDAVVELLCILGNQERVSVVVYLPG